MRAAETAPRGATGTTAITTTTTVPARGSVWDRLAAGLPVGLLLLDEHGAVLDSNDLAADLLGRTREELSSGLPPTGWRAGHESGGALPDTADLAGQVLRTGAPLVVPVLVSRHGVPHVRLWAKYQPVSLDGRPCLLVQLRPVHTDVGHAGGLVDPLTGLPNRALLLDRLDQALTRARTHGTLTSMVLLNVRGMARINAEFGFHRGDDLLVVLAARLREGLRADHTVARYGGDEFAVVADHPNGIGGEIAGRVQGLVERSVRIDRHRISPSARVCWLTSDGNTPVHSMIGHLESRLRVS
jgi:diguanylate cyclase (GGDEF)-like protein